MIRMLIDATHSEETRVAVVDGTRLIDYDYENKLRKQLKGSIFLAKVTRVEPSLQAAFVNFGGNRHGFLPFNEIHPDYFRIPIADREALIAAQQAELEALRAEEEAEDEEDQVSEGEQPGAEQDESADMVVEVGGEDQIASEDDAAEGQKDNVPDNESAEDKSAGESVTDIQPIADFTRSPDEDGDDENAAPEPGNEREQDSAEDVDGNGGDDNSSSTDRKSGDRDRFRGRGGRNRGRGRMQARSRRFEKHGDDEGEGARGSGRRNYKIQEVIKRGQIMLVQVSREERGNKGAAVTTYLSLPGRYCVLMPNSHRAGGVSRKVASFQERRRMREMLTELKVPDGMSVIMRTAGVSRTKPEVKRDLDYLLKLWDSIRELTLKSTAPSMVHEEGQLIRRAIRDIYARDVEEIHVAGEEGYKTARDFMKMMIPSHIKRVHEYLEEKTPLFQRYQVENQIASMSEPSVTLKSGGYLVINPTEALVSIDVNSGRATRERHIEETALKTNMEAAEEVARQLRLRDLGGLVVIDFIDMEDRRNNRRVENRLREALSSDRARIQMGRISSFGLLEMSRQRLNPSLTEAQFERCGHCKGTGFVRTVDMTAIMAMRALEEEGARARASEVVLLVPNAVAIYILNNKRAMLTDVERRYSFRIMIRVDESLTPAGFSVELLRGIDDGSTTADEGVEGGSEQPRNQERPVRDDENQGGEGRGGRRRGRRGGRGRNDGHFSDYRSGGNEKDEGFNDRNRDRQEEGVGNEDSSPDETGNNGEEPPSDANGNRVREGHESGEGRHRGRRRRRGGRGRGRGGFDRERGGDHRSSNSSRDHGSHQRSQHFHRGNEGRDDTGNNGGNFTTGADTGTRPAPESAAPVPQEGSVSPPSNDTRPAAAAPAPRDYERVNEPPADKKRGWWNRLTE